MDKEAEKLQWKSQKKLPRILKINRVRGLTVSVLFSNGQNRVLDFEEIFKKWKVTKKSLEYKLMNPAEFKKLKLEDYTLSWSNIRIKLDGFDGKKHIHPYQIGADVLYELSEPDENRERLTIGSMIKKERLKAGLTQTELADRIGTDKFYISRVEADQFQVEIATLRKIIEGGLHKRMEIVIR
ncbi:MAG TPA: helix-turn-helix transcriptional regulator [Bacteroidia bacterium]|jgi:DNA-binding XRE family transcriptional regulator|nr:helix-turn-helix transcriptional regulator [Bacteroidia bacterium]